MKPNAWKLGTIKQLTEYETTNRRFFNPDDYVIIEIYVPPNIEWKPNGKRNPIFRIGNLVKTITILGFLDLDGQRKNITQAYSIFERKVIYKINSTYTTKKYPWFCVCKDINLLTPEECKSIPHYFLTNRSDKAKIISKNNVTEI